MHFGGGRTLGKGCSIRIQSRKGRAMRKAPIRMGITLLAATLVGSLAVPSLAFDRSQGSGTSPAAATSVKGVKIINFAFMPKTITIAKGTKVKWTNGGSVNHTTTSNKGLWDSGALAPGATFAHVFRRAGTFKYHCTIHPTLMHGTIVVS
jgi:plastocyanin